MDMIGTGRRRAVAWSAAALLMGGGLALVGGTPQALAAGSSPLCSDGICTATLASVGVGQSYTVPDGVRSLSVTLYGAVGGTAIFGDVGSTPGGDGAKVAVTLAVTPGAAVGVDIGGSGGTSRGGTSPGGVNGGGTGLDASAAGGGATDVTLNNTRLIVAGGGGGAAAAVNDDGPCGSDALLGGAGGNAGTDGSPGATFAPAGLMLGGGGGGMAGSTSGAGHGGAGGTATGTDDCFPADGNGDMGNPGSVGVGGASSGASGTSGTIDSGTGGGGGGGEFGGGSGGASAGDLFYTGTGGGGGGGSSFVGRGGALSGGSIDDTGNTGQINDGNGEAIFSYADPVSTGPASYADTFGSPLAATAANGLLSATANTTEPGGDSLTAAGPASGETAHGGTVSVASDGSFTYTPPAGFTGSDSFTYTLTDVSGDSATGTATVDVSGLAPAFTADSPPTTVTAGSAYSYDFTASGTPAPTFSLGAGAPSWLSIAATTGQLTGIPPAGTTSFTYSVTASNSAGSVTAGPFTVEVQPAVTACTTTITGAHDTQLAVASGTTCLVNATQDGQVTVSAGATLSVTGSTINGTVTATDPAGITYCGSTEDGTLKVTGATGPVVLGGTLPGGGACAADTIPSLVTITGSGASAPVTVTGLKQNGTLTLEDNAGGVTLDGAQVSGLAYVENNAAAAAAITVAGNTVNGSLYCTGNSPAPVDGGTVNTVSGSATGQCAGLATR